MIRILHPNRRQLTKAMALGVAGLTLSSGLARRALAADRRIAIIVKNLGNGYFDACANGAREAAEEPGNTEIISTASTRPTAGDQIAVIDRKWVATTWETAIGSSALWA